MAAGSKHLVLTFLLRRNVKQVSHRDTTDNTSFSLSPEKNLMCLHVLTRSRIFLTSGQWSNNSDTTLADLLLIADNGVNKPSFLWGIDFSLKSLNSLISASIFTCNEASLKLLAFPLIFLEFEGVVSVDCCNFFDTVYAPQALHKSLYLIQK